MYDLQMFLPSCELSLYFLDKCSLQHRFFFLNFDEVQFSISSLVISVISKKPLSSSRSGRFITVKIYISVFSLGFYSFIS